MLVNKNFNGNTHNLELFFEKLRNLEAVSVTERNLDEYRIFVDPVFVDLRGRLTQIDRR
jgi:hypothetical protein